jgi:radical SAM superfamily enzyme YgiQ (UPF0313 family)
VGDHVTALPDESFRNSGIDYILTGGDYDFLLLNLLRWLEGNAKPEGGIWYRGNNEVKNTGPFKLSQQLDDTPMIDRDLTKWWLYSEKNGNFKRKPGTYMMVGRDCWWHRCAFCSWTTLYPTYRCRSPTKAVEEVEILIEKYGVKEIFDDTGSFPIGNWLKKFCEMMIERGCNREVLFSANMRFGALGFNEYALMKRAGFRELLFGLESGNQETLDRLDKNLRVEEIVDSCKKARKAGLEPHITIMIGYPWEAREQALKTLKLASILMDKGWAVTLQSTIVIPYPGTPLHDQALANGWFGINPEDYERYDMTEPILTTPDMKPEEVMALCDEMYKLFLSPKYMFKQFMRMRSLTDMRYTLYGLKKVLGHITDFRKE